MENYVMRLAGPIGPHSHSQSMGYEIFMEWKGDKLISLIWNFENSEYRCVILMIVLPE